MNRREKIIGTFGALAAAVFYGICSPLLQGALKSGVTSATILVVRFLGGMLLLWIYCFFRRIRFQSNKKDAFLLLVIGGVGYAAMSALNLEALKMIPTALATLLLCSYPVLVALFSVLLGRERFSWLLGASLAICLCGLWLVLDVQSSNVPLRGIIFGVSAAIAYALYALCGSAVGKEVDPIMRATLFTTGAWITYSVSGLLSGELDFHISVTAWLYFAGIIVLGTVIPMVLFWLSAEKIGIVNASILGTVEPVATAIFSVFFLKENLTSNQVLGIGIVVAGIVMAQILPLKYSKT